MTYNTTDSFFSIFNLFWVIYCHVSIKHILDTDNNFPFLAFIFGICPIHNIKNLPFIMRKDTFIHHCKDSDQPFHPSWFQEYLLPFINPRDPCYPYGAQRGSYQADMSLACEHQSEKVFHFDQAISQSTNVERYFILAHAISNLFPCVSHFSFQPNKPYDVNFNNKMI